MLTKETITFLKRLDRNNNREWLQTHAQGRLIV
jgi:hypothetical protein